MSLTKSKSIITCRIGDIATAKIELSKIIGTKSYRPIMECLICYEAGKIIVCEFCKYTSCETCLAHYFEAVVEPCCPDCKKVWNQLFLSTFSKKLYSSCTKLKAKFFLDSELALLPITQELATREKEAREILKNINEIRIII